MQSNEINNLIENGYENEKLDFKAIQYKNKESLLKDIMALANSDAYETKYIIVGIKAKPDGSKDIIGICESEFKDSSEYQQLILSNIEPDINIDYFQHKYKNKLIGILKIDKTNNKPYIMKKKYGRLEKGLCYIRKGSSQMIASRSDYDQMYQDKSKFSISLEDNFLLAKRKDGLASSRVLFKNHTENPVTIMDGVLEILDKKGNVLTKHFLQGYKDVETGADFSLHIPPKFDDLGEAWFSISSTDCIRLHMDEYGNTEIIESARLTIFDSNDNEYVSEKGSFYIIAKGDILWKVQKRRKR